MSEYKVSESLVYALNCMLTKLQKNINIDNSKNVHAIFDYVSSINFIIFTKENYENSKYTKLMYLKQMYTLIKSIYFIYYKDAVNKLDNYTLIQEYLSLLISYKYINYVDEYYQIINDCIQKCLEHIKLRIKNKELKFSEIVLYFEEDIITKEEFTTLIKDFEIDNTISISSSN